MQIHIHNSFTDILTLQKKRTASLEMILTSLQWLRLLKRPHSAFDSNLGSEHWHAALVWNHHFTQLWSFHRCTTYQLCTCNWKCWSGLLQENQAAIVRIQTQLNTHLSDRLQLCQSSVLVLLCQSASQHLVYLLQEQKMRMRRTHTDTYIGYLFIYLPFCWLSVSTDA